MSVTFTKIRVPSPLTRNESESGLIRGRVNSTADVHFDDYLRNLWGVPFVLGGLIYSVRFGKSSNFIEGRGRLAVSVNLETLSLDWPCIF
jgi:hypothetical protein